MFFVFKSLFFFVLGVIRGIFPPNSRKVLSSSVVFSVFLCFYLLGVMRGHCLLIVIVMHFAVNYFVACYNLLNLVFKREESIIWEV